MSFEKITEAELAGLGVVGMADAPGLPAREMQEKLEEVVRSAVIPAFNRLIDALGAKTAAAALGFGSVEGLEAATIQEAVTALKRYIDQKAIDAGAADMTKAVYDQNGLGIDIYQYAAKAAKKALDTATQQMNEISAAVLTHEKADTTHALTGLGERSGILQAMFRATADYTSGDTFTVDGTAYTALMPDGEGLSDGFFVSGAVIGCIIDTAALTINFKGGGGVKLPALTNPAGAEQILSGYQGIGPDGSLVEGTLSAYKMVTGTMTGGSSGQTVTVDGTIHSAVAFMTVGSQTYISAVCPSKTTLQSFHNAGNHQSGTVSLPAANTFRYANADSTQITYWIFYEPTEE